MADDVVTGPTGTAGGLRERPAANDPSDVELLEQWRGGDRKAGQALFERHYDAIYRFFDSKVREDVADLVQSTFVACVEGRDRFEGAAAFKTYLFGIAKYKLYEHFKRRRRNARVADVDPASMSIEEVGGSPSTWLRDQYDLQLLRRALPRIPLDMQLLIELYLWEGFTGGQLGRVMGIPENTVRARIRRAKELLEREFRKLEASPEEVTATLRSLSLWLAEMRELKDDRYPGMGGSDSGKLTNS